LHRVTGSLSLEAVVGAVAAAAVVAQAASAALVAPAASGAAWARVVCPAAALVPQAQPVVVAEAPEVVAALEERGLALPVLYSWPLLMTALVE
jgi:hypothetical protein